MFFEWLMPKKLHFTKENGKKIKPPFEHMHPFEHISRVTHIENNKYNVYIYYQNRIYSERMLSEQLSTNSNIIIRASVLLVV